MKPFEQLCSSAVPCNLEVVSDNCLFGGWLARPEPDPLPWLWPLHLLIAIAVEQLATWSVNALVSVTRMHPMMSGCYPFNC